jgi:Ca2+-binding RTX toxin-like protein
MANFVTINPGAALNETVIPGFVSGSILRFPANSFPSAANDFFDLGNGNDTANGAGGSDTLLGGAGNDVLDGSLGNDSVAGGAGNDVVLGGDGRDTLDGGNNNDTVLGGGGNDSMNGGNGNDSLEGGEGNDTVNGGAGVDTIAGGNGNDTANGGGGADVMFGGDGNDVLNGADGNDILTGGLGRDVMAGGAGADIYDYNLTSESNGASRDLITDFVFDVDRIDLSTIDANTGLGGNQAFSTIEGNGIGELNFTDLANGNTLIQSDVNGDGFADLQIEVADGATSASVWSPSLDFIL